MKLEGEYKTNERCSVILIKKRDALCIILPLLMIKDDSVVGDKWKKMKIRKLITIREKNKIFGFHRHFLFRIS